MRARRARQEPVDEPPAHLLRLDPERYRDVAVQALRDHPGDGWCAAVAVWRAWQHEAQDWQAERGIVRGVKGYKRQLVSCRPPVAWVCAEFKVSVEADSETVCPPVCKTHAGQRLR